jgi:hypothetical protein
MVAGGFQPETGPTAGLLPVWQARNRGRPDAWSHGPAIRDRRIIPTVPPPFSAETMDISEHGIANWGADKAAPGHPGENAGLRSEPPAGSGSSFGGSRWTMICWNSQGQSGHTCPI